MTKEPPDNLPQYKCHKVVGALKIKNLSDKASGCVMTPEEEGYWPIFVTDDWVEKHAPKVGGYYVIYEDGYQSFSPSSAFEKGYTKL